MFVKKKWKSGMLMGVFVLFLCTYIPVCAEEKFEGSRLTVCSISQSDLDNFVSGGRPALEMILSQNEEKWYAVSLESEGRDLLLYLKYSFDSFEEYKEETTRLIGSEPVTTYGEKAVSYIENFLPSELFGFLNHAMQRAGVVQENYFSNALEVRRDTMKLNGEEYTGTKALNLSGESKIMADKISVSTTLQEKTYTREVELTLAEDGAYSAVQMLDERSKKIQAETKQDEREYFVSFAADSENELIKKTMIVLGAAVDITHKKHYSTQDTVRLETRDWIDADWLLTEEGTYSYHMEYPEEYQNLSTEIENVEDKEETKTTEDEKERAVVRGQEISYEGTGMSVTWYYDIPIRFDEVTVITDLSDRTGKMERTITFYMDWDIADACHEAVKEELCGRMERGDILRIYDEQGYRHYEMRRTSWSDKDVADFSERILKADKSIFASNKSILPFLKSHVKENIVLSEAEVYSEEIRAEYIFPGHDEETVRSGMDFQADFSFQGFYYVKMAVCALMLLVLMGITICMIWIVKKSAEQAKERWKAGRRCPVCGAARKGTEKFCGKCGHRF